MTRIIVGSFDRPAFSDIDLGCDLKAGTVSLWGDGGTLIARLDHEEAMAFWEVLRDMLIDIRGWSPCTPKSK